MINKSLAIILLLLANIVLLVHLAVPHHHHQEIVCFDDSHCDSDDHSNEDHEHDGAEESSECMLDYVISIRINQDHQKLVKLKILDIMNKFQLHQAIVADVSTDFSSDHQKPREKEHVFICSPDLIIHSKGLRAPPTV